MKRPAALATTVALFLAAAAFAGRRPAPACAPDNGGLKLPAGFCATLFADSLSAPRHMVVAPNGDLIVAVRSTQQVPGGIVALRDANGDGKADQRSKTGSFNATEVRLLGNYLYTENTSAILRYPWRDGSLEPSGPPDTIVAGLPIMGHAAKTFVIYNGQLLVNQGSRTNSCQENDRFKESKGIEPCPELAERAGIWRYSAERKGQTLKDGERYATGVRNAVAMAIEPRTNELYVMQHGRDQLGDNWPALFNSQKSAETPSEELLHIRKGADYGWPYCYFDGSMGSLVLAPEYGGDGRQTGRCASKQAPVGTFPAHWAPDGMLFYTGSELPARFRNGAFIAFHGSWNRSPEPQAGFRVVFQPMASGKAQGAFETIVDGFVDAGGKPTELGGRPCGIAQGRRGELYVSDDAKGRIWRIEYVGAR
ncbi:MAG TPA: PQQ-dependent sugar dehydrogenase [Gemmatimonadaceae bacterium]|nr:PQQ-dependent sugar dehydrogenase [Gemmatimonadaceae bacterium]